MSSSEGKREPEVSLMGGFQKVPRMIPGGEADIPGYDCNVTNCHVPLAYINKIYLSRRISMGIIKGSQVFKGCWNSNWLKKYWGFFQFQCFT